MLSSEPLCGQMSVCCQDLRFAQDCKVAGSPGYFWSGMWIVMTRVPDLAPALLGRSVFSHHLCAGVFTQKQKCFLIDFCLKHFICELNFAK